EVMLPRKVGEAVDALATLDPNDQRAAEVVKVLAGAARATDLHAVVRADAARALGRWRTPESLAALSEVVNDSSVGVRHAAIEGLGTYATEEAAVPITSRLLSSQDRAHAASILQGMGSVAERAVIPALGHESPEVRATACKVLSEIGTVKSLPALERAAGDASPLVRQAAFLAFRSASKRK